MIVTVGLMFIEIGIVQYFISAEYSKFDGLLVKMETAIEEAKQEYLNTHTTIDQQELADIEKTLIETQFSKELSTTILNVCTLLIIMIEYTILFGFAYRKYLKISDQYSRYKFTTAKMFTVSINITRK